MIHSYSKNDAGKKLSKNFKVREFSCKCGCGATFIDDRLVEILQKIRDHFKTNVNITSGYRCQTHNASPKVGGNPGSHHVKGMAADIVVKKVDPKEVAKFAESIGVKRIGLYSNFVHIGSDENKYFWIGSDKKKVETFSMDFELPILRYGSRANSVWSLQALLVGFGYNLGSSGVKKDGVDGSFGKKTEDALKKYQLENDLAQTGISDAETWASLLGVD